MPSSLRAGQGRLPLSDRSNPGRIRPSHPGPSPMSAPRAVYSELDPFSADWLEALVQAGELPAGRVDRRDVRTLRGEDCGETTYLFAGIVSMLLNHERKGPHNWDDAVPSLCPDCGARLVARRGMVVVWHWAHQAATQGGGGTGCGAEES